MSDTTCAVMEQWRSKTVQWVSMVMSPVPLPPTNTAVCIYASIVIWRAVPHNINAVLHTQLCEFLFKLNTAYQDFIKLVSIFVEIIATSFECQLMTVRLEGNIPQMHRSINDVLNNASTARFSTIPRQVPTRMSPMPMSNGPKPSLFTPLQLAVRNWGNVIDLVDSIQEGGSLW